MTKKTDWTDRPLEMKLKPFDETGGRHVHTYDTVTRWDHHPGSYSGMLDYSVALEVMCSGCLERKSLEETV